MRIPPCATTALVCAILGIVGHAQAQTGTPPPDRAAQPARPAPARDAEVPPRRPTVESQPRKEDEPAPTGAQRPGDAHARFDPLVGRWDARVTATFPGRESTTTSGVARYEWVLGDPEGNRGNFLRQDFRGELMGMPFRGLGYWGHDNARREYTSAWMDSLSTSTTMGLGTFDAQSRAFTFRSEYQGPDGQKWQARSVLTIVDDNRHTFEYYQAAPGAEERKTMEIVYTRARPGAPEDPERRERMRPRSPEGDRPDPRTSTPGRERDEGPR